MGIFELFYYNVKYKESCFEMFETMLETMLCVLNVGNLRLNKEM